MRRSPPFVLSEADRQRLLRMAAHRSTPRRVARRLRIVVLASKGIPYLEIASRLRTSTVTVGLWTRRYRADGLDRVLHDASSQGGRPRLPSKLVARIIETTLHTGLPGGGQWTSRRLAEYLGVSHTTVQRVWRHHHLTGRLSSRRARGDSNP